MRCKACNSLMTEVDCARKDTRGEFVDLCGTCHSHSVAAAMDLYEELGNPEDGTIAQEDTFEIEQTYATILTQVDNLG